MTDGKITVPFQRKFFRVFDSISVSEYSSSDTLLTEQPAVFNVHLGCILSNVYWSVGELNTGTAARRSVSHAQRERHRFAAVEPVRIEAADRSVAEHLFCNDPAERGRTHQSVPTETRSDEDVGFEFAQ